VYHMRTPCLFLEATQVSLEALSLSNFCALRFGDRRAGFVEYRWKYMKPGLTLVLPLSLATQFLLSGM
jgi:hypothetical protein